MEHVSKTQSAKTYSSDSDLWDKASRQLRESSEDKCIVAVVESFPGSPAADNATLKSGTSTIKGFSKDIKYL